MRVSGEILLDGWPLFAKLYVSVEIPLLVQFAYHACHSSKSRISYSRLQESCFLDHTKMKSKNKKTRKPVIVTISCLSGGSGKTTTALNLATMLAERSKTLAVDFDPQGNLSQWLGWSDLSETATIAETILSNEDRIEIEAIIQSPLNEERNSLFLAPSDYSLSSAVDAIAMQPGRERVLKRALKPVLSLYDYIVIDSPPSKGILTYNAVLAADHLVLPTECTHKGVSGAVNTLVLIDELQELEFDVPKVLGIIPTREQWAGARRTRMCRAALETLHSSVNGTHIFSALRQSTLVQQTNNSGWSLDEAGEAVLSKPFQEVVEAIINEAS